MDHLQKFTADIRDYLIVLFIVNDLLIFGDWYIAERILHLSGWAFALAALPVPIIAVSVLAVAGAKYIVQPTRLLWQAILHIAPDVANVSAPNLRQARLGREMVTNLITHVYQIANVVENVEKLASKQPPDLRANFIANNLPLPMIVLDKSDNILFANSAMLAYIKREAGEVAGQNVYSVLDMSFSSEHTFDRWLQYAKANKVTASRSWERVRLQITDQKITRLFDLAGYYNRNNPQGLETMLVMFDRTRAYTQDDQAMGFVALAVHELRTPLTLLRGYIEVFEDELAGKVNSELADFLHKMQASAQQLTAFINNILNVSRYENDQLVLQLHEEKWGDIVASAVSDMRLRAGVQGIKLNVSIAPNLPTVGADRVSTYEVISNLIDNAIKYSGSSKEVNIAAKLNSEGLIETTVQDFGVGIPEAAMSNLFDKYYRNYRNRAQIGGTGMGLYLAKAIVEAHSGHIWVRSKEGQGSTFGFTLQPYAQLAAERKTSDNTDIVRSAHGWIKNHSLYRR